jgi:hypothetical protein
LIISQPSAHGTSNGRLTNLCLLVMLSHPHNLILSSSQVKSKAVGGHRTGRQHHPSTRCHTSTVITWSRTQRFVSQRVVSHPRMQQRKLCSRAYMSESRHVPTTRRYHITCRIATHAAKQARNLKERKTKGNCSATPCHPPSHSSTLRSPIDQSESTHSNNRVSQEQSRVEQGN